MSEKKCRRDVVLRVRVSQDEYDLIRQLMEKAGVRNLSGYMRKMLLNGYFLNVDLSPVRELVSLQRRCSNNLNQVAKHANSYGFYASDIKTLQKDYAELWEQISDMMKQLAAVADL